MVRFGLSGIGGVALVQCVQPLLFAQREVPLVGCKSVGQADPIDAPTGSSVLVPMSPETARRLAFYKAGVIDGVPRTARLEHALGIYGSGGAALVVSPEPLTRRRCFRLIGKGSRAR